LLSRQQHSSAHAGNTTALTQARAQGGSGGPTCTRTLAISDLSASCSRRISASRFAPPAGNVFASGTAPVAPSCPGGWAGWAGAAWAGRLPPLSKFAMKSGEPKVSCGGRALGELALKEIQIEDAKTPDPCKLRELGNWTWTTKGSRFCPRSKPRVTLLVADVDQCSNDKASN
jgi:hypothetical protein